MHQKAVFFIIMGILCLSISCAKENQYYRLPKTIRASVYHLNITVNMDNDTFEGDLLFDFRVLIPTKSIEMHKSSKLKIKGQISLTLTAQHDNKMEIEDYHESNNLLVITLKKELHEDLRYRLNITKFQGVIHMIETGFYTYGYVDESGQKTKYAAALLKPAFARNVFPCLDEPDQKAIFKISITRPNKYNSLSNGIKIRSTAVGTNMTRDDFEDTLFMSTYLVSFIVSQFSFSNKVLNVHRAVARQHAIKLQQTDYSITAADNILKKFEEYINIKYALKHLYHVALPMDLSTNMALATWGLIVYKESFLLIDNPTSSEKEVINELIAHQIAHLYFENLITLKWWRHNWLHEGLSDFLSYKLVDEMYPKWLAKTNFKLKVLDALYRDSFPYSEALEGNELTPTQVHDNTHIILRPKGAAMMYMLESIVTPTIFKNAIRNYLKNNAYKNVEPEDLYIAMDYIPSVKLLPKKLEFIMWTWNTQIGYPVVHVTRNYYSSDDVSIINLEQNPFNIKQSIAKTNMPVWYIPINYAFENNPDFSDLEPKAWLHSRTAKIRIKNLNMDDYGSWLLINKQGAYFYRVNYDKHNWFLITKALLRNYTSIHVFHRMQLIDDSNALAKGDIIKYDILFGILEYLPKETEYGPLSVIKKITVELYYRLAGTEADKFFHEYIGNPVEIMYNQLKKKAKSSTDHILSMKLKLLFTWLCELNHTRCKSETRLYYAKFKSGLNIPPELEEQVFCTAVQMGEKISWSSMFAQIRSSKNDEFPKTKFKALACTEDEQSLRKYLNYIKSLSSDRLALGLLSVSVKRRTTRGLLTVLASNLLVGLVTKFGDKIVEVVVSNIGSAIHDKFSFLKFKKIADQQPKYRYLFEPGLELAENNIKWREEHVEEFTTLLRNSISPISSGCTYYHSSLNIFLVVYTLFVTILNYIN